MAYEVVDLAPVLFWPHFVLLIPSPWAAPVSFQPLALLLPFPDHTGSLPCRDLVRAVLWMSLSSLRLCSLTSFRSLARGLPGAPVVQRTSWLRSPPPPLDSLRHCFVSLVLINMEHNLYFTYPVFVSLFPSFSDPPTSQGGRGFTCVLPALFTSCHYSTWHSWNSVFV